MSEVRGAPVSGAPYDTDGTGSYTVAEPGDWTVAGPHFPYTPEAWAALKAGSLRRRRIWGFREMYVADEPRAGRKHADPAAIAQYIIGYGTLAAFLAIVITVTLAITGI